MAAAGAAAAAAERGPEHKRGASDAATRRRRGPGPIATAYMVIYNVVMTAGWMVIAVGLVRAGVARGTYHGLYYSIEKPLKFFQTGALLEIVHCALGIVPSSVVLTGFQVMSRVFLTWAVTHSVKQVQSEDSVLLFVAAWTLTEIVRYSFYTFSLLNHLPYPIKWARYSLFIALYPMGVTGELLTIYAALPHVRRTGLYSVTLPNTYNVSFDYYTVLIMVMVSYIPIFPQLYFHMLRQRRKVLGTAEQSKKIE
ncbi:very-long-chain (3R)-3-hydroxyacyl-CoA dehydratase 2 isoform X1 [Rhinoraja longicauda]